MASRNGPTPYSDGASDSDSRNSAATSRGAASAGGTPSRARLQVEADFDQSALPPNAAFVISVAARLVGVHEQTLRYYERAGLVEPARSKGRIRLYSLYDLERVRQIRRLTDEMGVNLAGVEVILRLTDRIRELERKNEELQAEVRRLSSTSSRQPRGDTAWT
jgi:MerR family transcriptional regulator/heat shock protein HspR